MQFKENILKFGIKWKWVGKCAFSKENWPYLKNGKR